MISVIRYVLVAVVFGACEALASVACAGTPAVNLVTAPLVTPSSAWTYYGSSTTHTTGIAAWSTTPPEIQAMATSLGAARYAAGTITAAQYTQYVYDYVRNSIAVEFRFGLGKGGRGALIDQSGTPFDQAELMVKLLRAANITAGYQVGTITLTAQQFGLWSGFVTGLTQSAQTFSVNAQAACQFLADGGIPATVNGATTCSGLTGNLTTVTMGHIWVSANSLLYDPSYKQNTLYSSIDIAAAMSCGTASAPTCGATAEAAAMTGATQGTLAGSPTIKSLNETALQSQLQTYAVNLESYIKTNLVTPARPYPRLQEVVGGILVNTSYDPAPASSLPYTSALQYSWSGDIPDQFRSIVQIVYPATTITLYGDEIAGRGVYFYNDADNFTTPGTGNWRLRVDTGDVFFSPTGCCATPTQFNLVVNHPYAANSGSYADESVDFTPTFKTDFLSVNAISTIVVSFGDSSPSTASHYSDLQQSSLAPYQDCSGTPNQSQLPNWEFECADFTDRHLASMSNFLSQQSAADKVVMAVGSAFTTRHHSIGLIQGPSAPLITLDTAVSANSVTANATSRQSVFTVLTALDAMLEGSMFQQQQDVPEANSAPALFHRSNVDQTAFIDVTSSQMSAVLPNLTNYSLAGQAYPTGRTTNLTNMAAAGYEVIVPQSGTTSCGYYDPNASCFRYGGDYAFNANSTALLVEEALKGGEGTSAIDPNSAAIKTTRQTDYSLLQKKYSSVDAATGTLTLTPPPDIIAGAGDFPYSLPFTRTYSSAGRVGNWLFVPYSDAGAAPTDRGHDGPDIFATGRLGGAWVHNYDIAAEISNDGYEAFGAHGGLPASAAIAALFSLYDINKTADFPHRLTSVLGTYWFGSTYLMGHTVLIHKGLKTETFEKLPDSTYAPLKASQATLAQSGAVVPMNQTYGLGTPKYGRNDYASTKFTYTDGDGAILSFNQCQMIVDKWCNSTFPISSWAFPSGVTVQFAYQSIPSPYGVDGSGNSTAGEGVGFLTTVSNNLGRTLTFAAGAAIGTRTDPGAPQLIASVTSDGGQVAKYSVSNCQAPYWWDLCNSFSVTTPDTATSKYDYTVGTDSPDPTIAYPSQNYRLRRVFFPVTPTTPTYIYAYDQKNRLASITDALSYKTTYDSGGLYAEQWRRADTIDPLGAVTTSYFDDGGSLLATIDPLGRMTSYTYDLSRRLTLTTLPEGNSIANSYDVRNNKLTETRHAKPGSGFSDLTTQTTYGGSATVTNCSNPVTCNLVATTTDAHGNVTQYAYNASGNGSFSSTGTGQIKTIVGPAVAGGNAQTNYCYGLYNTSISLLTGKVDQVDSSTTRVKTYVYNSSNKYVLGSVTVDPTSSLSASCGALTKSSGLNLISSFTFDSVGNVHTIADPRGNTASYTTTYSFDGMRRLTEVDGPSGSNVKTVYGYDLDGELLTTQRQEMVSGSPVLRTETRAYWPTGYLKTVQDPDGYVTSYGFNSGGQLLDGYDPDGRLVYVTDPDGRVTKTDYDSAGETVHSWSAWGSTQPGMPIEYAQFTYTPNGKQLTVKDANGNETDFAYDGQDRLTFTAFPSPVDGSRCTLPNFALGSPTCNTTSKQTYEGQWFSVDGTPTGALCSGSEQVCRRLTRRGDLLTLTYDALNREATKTVSSLPIVSYAYNLLSEPTSLSNPSSGGFAAHTIAYNYDSAGRKAYESNDGRQVSYGYDPAGNRSSIQWPDGYLVSYQYDALNRMQYVWEGAVGTTQLAYYGYDELSRRKTLQLSGQGATNSLSYAYEPNSYLDSIANQLNATNVILSYGRNKSGQITSLTASDDFYLGSEPSSGATYAVNNLNQYSTINNASIGYDLDGNLLSWTSPTNGAQAYTYDAEKRLRTANSAGTGITYDYDPLGRRVSKVVGGTTTNYLLEGNDEIAEIDGSGNVLRRYVSGAGTDDLILMIDVQNGNAKTFFHVNHQGSVIAMTDVSGNVQQRLSYDEFGNLSSGSSTTGQQFRYTGRRFDPETGLYYYRARYYAPQLGRFLQTDPVGYQDDVNLYGYTKNDPVNGDDPTGLADTASGAADPVELKGVSVTGSRGGSGSSGSLTLVAVQLQAVHVRAARPIGSGFLGLVPGVDLYDALGNPYASKWDYSMAIFGMIPGEGPLGAMFKTGTRALKDFKLLHSAEVIGGNAELKKLTDEELLNAVKKPTNGDMVKVNSKTDNVVDGNSRISELQRRAADPNSSITPDTQIPFETHTPDDSMFPN